MALFIDQARRHASRIAYRDPVTAVIIRDLARKLEEQQVLIEALAAARAESTAAIENVQASIAIVETLIDVEGCALCAGRVHAADLANAKTKAEREKR